tara:strand:+ start:157 stop:510 length:354 start_codon:yes stop_codon:yes gene_type:complete
MSEGLDHTSLKPESKNNKSLGTLYTVIGVIIGIAVARMFRASLVFKALGGTVAGFLLGLIPFFIAKNRGDEKLARIALGICTLSGVIFGRLRAIPVCIIFVVIILTRQRKDNTHVAE